MWCIERWGVIPVECNVQRVCLHVILGNNCYLHVDMAFPSINAVVHNTTRLNQDKKLIKSKRSQRLVYVEKKLEAGEWWSDS